MDFLSCWCVSRFTENWFFFFFAAEDGKWLIKLCRQQLQFKEAKCVQTSSFIIILYSSQTLWRQKHMTSPETVWRYSVTTKTENQLSVNTLVFQNKYLLPDFNYSFSKLNKINWKSERERSRKRLQKEEVRGKWLLINQFVERMGNNLDNLFELF